MLWVKFLIYLSSKDNLLELSAALVLHKHRTLLVGVSYVTEKLENLEEARDGLRPKTQIIFLVPQFLKNEKEKIP